MPQLTTDPPAARIWVAYSGGRDSVVLLHALAQCRPRLSAPLHAVHVDHGLLPDAVAWGEHCARQCRQLGIPLRRISVDARARRGESPEAAAREARYAAFAELLGEGELLLTAHHRDDQGETLLLQLMRGSGTRGLAAMPSRLALGRGTLLRPLLDYTRAELAVWADAQRLAWIEDPSNRDQALDRNFLRHSVLPLLERRWPAVEANLARAAGHQQDASELLDQLAAQDLSGVAEGGGAQLRIAALADLSPARLRNLLRFWLRRRGLRPPPARVLQRVLDELIPAGGDRNPLVHWPGGELRRYRGRIYALSPVAEPDPKAQHWDLRTPLPFVDGLLTARRVAGDGLRASLCEHGVTVTSRCGGERCRPAGKGHHQQLKKLMQQAGIPPWERPRLPMIIIDGKLVQAVGLCLGDEWAAGPKEEGILIQFSDR